MCIALKKGRLAYQRGRPRIDNDYPRGVQEYALWLRGWREAEAEDHRAFMKNNS